MKRWDELRAAWDKFVLDRDTWGDDRDGREAEARAVLEASEAQLRLESLFWSGQWAELVDRVHRAANLKSAAWEFTSARARRPIVSPHDLRDWNG